ncbi:MAG: lysophospholipid acyltransferase family protein, partial [Paracoccaceae bacterium]
KLIKSTSRNIGKTIIELFSPKDIVALAKKTEIEGPGLSVLAQAAKEGRSVICVSGHFGNYDVARAALIAQGFDLGALYRRLNNKVFHRYYFDNITTTGTPMFERGRPGLGDMVRHIKNGRPLAMLIDQHMDDGAALQFFGQTAYTALSAAQMALKYDAELVPFYAIRQSTGAPFRIILEAPITRGSAETMTQALNDSLEARVRADMGQWLWSHKRWKEPRKTQ